MGFDDVMNDLWGSSEEEAPTGVKWNAMKMARYFEKQLFTTKSIGGFAMVNVAGLSSQFTKWRAAGRTEAEVRRLIDTYMADPSVRGENPGWKDFLYRAEQIHAKVSSVPQKSAEELLEDAYELGTLEAFMEAFPGNPGKAHKYYEMLSGE